MAYADPEDKRRYHREYMAQRRQWFRAHGRCPECGQRDAYTMAGRAICATCTERRSAQIREYQRRNARARAERSNHIRAVRRSEGLCPECGGAREDARYIMCARCRARSRRSHERSRREHGILPKSVYAELGLCAQCGKRPPMPGETRWDGRPIRLCQACYDALTKAAAKGRAAYLERNGETWGQRQYELHRRLKSARESENMERFLHRPIL